MGEVSRLAIAAVGPNSPGEDWVLDPKRHAEQLPPEAGALRRILLSGAVQEVVANYQRDDVFAAGYQRTHRRLAGLHTFARYMEAAARPLAIVVAVIFLLPLQNLLTVRGLTSLSENPSVSHVAFLSEFAVLLLLLVFTSIQLKAPAFYHWLEHRAKAERLRYELFLRIMGADEGKREGEIPVLPLKLEYFRRFNLGVQSAYFNVRMKSRSRPSLLSPAAWVIIILLTLAVWMVIWLGSMYGVLQVSSLLVERSFFVAGGVAALVVGTRRAAGEYELEMRQRIEEANLIDNLAYLQERFLDEARQAAANGDVEGVSRFVLMVQAQVFRDTARLRDFN